MDDSELSHILIVAKVWSLPRIKRQIVLVWIILSMERTQEMERGNNKTDK